MDSICLAVALSRNMWPAYVYDILAALLFAGYDVP